MKRIDLPKRRPGETFEFMHEGHRYMANEGLHLHGRPQEVFLTTGKPGTGVETACRDAAVPVRLALQHGVPVETLSRAMNRLDDGSAAGTLGLLLHAISLHFLEVHK